ncbi:hypothetical protein M569_08952, partial [Genlisea aurea]
MESQEFPRRGMDPIDESSDALFHGRRRRCFYFPCFDRSEADSSRGGDGTGAPSWWTKMSGSALWTRGVDALMKIREWSEILAGPRWKTFIRRFNRNRGGGGNGKHANYQYDPLSYAMNFDEGNGISDLEADEAYYSRNFSSRYAKGSIDLPYK